VGTLLFGVLSTPTNGAPAYAGQSADVAGYKILASGSAMSLQYLSLDFDDRIWQYASAITVRDCNGDVIGQVTNLTAGDFTEIGAGSDYRIVLPVQNYVVNLGQTDSLTVNLTFLPDSGLPSVTLDVIQAQVRSVDITGVTDTETLLISHSFDYMNGSYAATVTPGSVGAPTYTATAQPDVSGYTAATFPFTFTVNAGSTPVYISATPASVAAIDTSLQASNVTAVGINSSSSIPGDTNTGFGTGATGSFIVAANSSRTFTLNATISNIGGQSTAENAIMEIGAVYYSETMTPSGSTTSVGSESSYSGGQLSSILQSPPVTLLDQ
jgi:hypothetical protein